jgi:hypothetical protein
MTGLSMSYPPVAVPVAITKKKCLFHQEEALYVVAN